MRTSKFNTMPFGFFNFGILHRKCDFCPIGFRCLPIYGPRSIARHQSVFPGNSWFNLFRYEFFITKPWTSSKPVVMFCFRGHQSVNHIVHIVRRIRYVAYTMSHGWYKDKTASKFSQINVIYECLSWRKILRFSCLSNFWRFICIFIYYLFMSVSQSVTFSI